MKKLSFSLLVILGFFATLFISCDEEDDGPDLGPPVFTSDPDDQSVEVGGTVALSFEAETPGGYQSSSVASSDDAIATATITSEPSNSTSSSGSFEVTVTGVAEGEATITLTVTDNESQSATNDVVITVGAENPPSGGMANIGDTIPDFEDLSTLAAALEATDLDEVLNGDGPFTVFAPNNAAFTALLEALELESLDDVVAALGADGVSQVLQAHVVGESLAAADLQAQDYTTVNDSIITITVDGDNVFANGAQVVTADIMAGNGVIHVIDSVINLPAVNVEEPGEEITVASSEEGVGDVTWTANNTYILDGLIYVNDGQTLTIEPGTVIKGNPGQGGDASALIVARGGVIEANGTAEAPIIFTAVSDDLNGSVADDARGLWGGIIILGRASTNNNDTNGEKNVEGIPTEDTRGVYGGTDDADDSGTLNYVSIRHGGSLIGEENEINGLTLGGVGNGTQISNIEVWANLDDGIEFFGGTVNASNLFVAYCGDDGLDADEGYQGNVQKAIVWQTSPTLRSDDPSAMELDGGVGANETAEPFSLPNFANLTLFYDEGDNDLTNAINIRDNSGASIYNSIAINHDATFAVERRTDIGGAATDVVGSSFERFEMGELVISGNIFFNINGVTDAANLADAVEVSNESTADAETALETAIADNNSIVDPTFGTGATKFTPSAEAVTSELATLPESGGFLQTLTYKGAVDPAATAPYFANWSKAWAVINQ